MKCLITATEGDVGQALVQILRSSFPEWSFYGCDRSSEFQRDSLFVEQLLSIDASNVDYVNWLERSIDEFAIDLVIPGSDAEILAISKSGALSVNVVMPNEYAVVTGSEKILTYRFLKESGLPVPQTVLIDGKIDFDFPFIVKPNIGRGSKDVEICSDALQLEELRRLYPNSIAQELLHPSSEEMTCAVMRTKSGQIGVLALRRRIKNGASVWAQVVRDDEIVAYCTAIAEKINLRGSINIQLINTAQGPKAFEINARFSSTVGLRHKLGFTDLVWAIQDQVLDIPVRIFDPKDGIVANKNDEWIIEE
jgi:carbamoyl-phosphate synthase large subunit